MDFTGYRHSATIEPTWMPSTWDCVTSVDISAPQEALMAPFRITLATYGVNVRQNKRQRS
jgi:hypothetical protein